MKKTLINRILARFNEDLRRDLDASGELKIYRKGEYLIRTGDLFDFTYIVLNGCIQIARRGQNDEEYVFDFLKAGAGFGVSIREDSSLKSKLSFMDCKAIDISYVLLLPFSVKDSLALKHDQWYGYILESAVQYHQIYLDQIDSIAFQKLDYRIERYLEKLSDALNSKKLKITHLDIATSLNVSREAVSRLLKKMEELGKIYLSPSMIEIKK